LSSNNNNSGGGIGLLGAFFLVLFVLKIIGTLTWSWWWVTAPLWGPLGLVALVFGAIGLALVVGKGRNKKLYRKRTRALNKARRRS
jgi:hypothetical protein